MTQSLTDVNEGKTALGPSLPILVMLCFIVLLYRVAAYFNPSGMVVIPLSMAVPLNALGILYLVCGVYAWISNPSRLTRVFFLSTLGMSIHWGGVIATENNGVEIALLVFYASVSAMGDAAALDLSLRYPREIRRRGIGAIGFYVLAIITFIAIPIAPFVPREILAKGLEFVFGVAFLMSIVAGIVFIVKWFRFNPADRRKYSLTLIVGALVISGGLDLMADSGLLPGIPEAWSLLYGLEPLALAWALTRRGVISTTDISSS